MKYWKNQKNILKASSLWDKQLNYLYFVECIFLLVVVGISKLWIFAMNTLSAPTFGQAAINQITDAASLEALTKAAVSFFAIFFITLILLVLFYLVAYCISRAIVWKTVMKKKKDYKVFHRFVYLKIAWLLLWSPIYIIFLTPAFLLSSTVQVNPALYNAYALVLYANVALWLIISYFGLFLYASYFEHHKIYKSITDAFKNGAKNFKKMIIPLLLVIIAWLLWWLVAKGLILMGIDDVVAAIRIPLWLPTVLISIYILQTTRRYLIHTVTKMSH